MDSLLVVSTRAWVAALWLVTLVLAGCKPPLLHDLQLWDEECQFLTDQSRLIPSLDSLQTPEIQARRAALARRLLVAVPRANPLALALDLHPELKAGADADFTPRPYAKGEIESFWVGTPQPGGGRHLEARLIRVSDVSYTWVEAEADHQDAYLANLAARFDEEVYKPSQWLYGFENSEGFDQDPRVHLLFATKLGKVLGYFNSSTTVSKAVLPLSNEKDLLFLNLDYIGDEERDLDVLAHELQHLIHWFHDPSERGFLNEGLSELAPPLLFAKMNDRLVNNIAAYAHDPNLQLNSWSLEDNASMRHYGAGGAFALYLTETFGPQILSQIVHEPLPGIGGLTQLLTDRGCPFTFDDLYADFVVANLVQTPQELGAAARLGYLSLDTRWPGPASDSAFVPHYRFRDQQGVKGTLLPYATQYIDVTGVTREKTLHLFFQGQSAVPFATPEFAPPLMWSNRMNGSAVRLTRTFDLTELVPGVEVRLDTTMWWDIEKNWDYGYVTVSRDGRDWDLLESPVTGTADPNGVALGPGLTGQPGHGAVDSEMQRVSWDVSEYAGQMLHVRFDYVTDGAVTAQGWQIGQVAIEAIGFQEDFSGTLEDWHNEGWIQVRERLPIVWLVQAVHLGDKGSTLLAWKRLVAAPDGSLALTLPAPAAAEDMYLLVTPLAPLVSTQAEYEIQLRESSHP